MIVLTLNGKPLSLVPIPCQINATTFERNFVEINYNKSLFSIYAYIFGNFLSYGFRLNILSYEFLPSLICAASFAHRILLDLFTLICL
jgi:hypothetical protein